jgi:hypothetical protein
LILIFKSTQIEGLQQSVRERFGKGSLGADPRLVGGEVSSSLERKNTMERGDELSVLLSRWISFWSELELLVVRARMMCSESS